MNDSFSEFYMTFMENMMMYECMDNITYEAIQKNHKSFFFVSAGKVNEDFMDRAYHRPNIVEKLNEYRHSNFVQFIYNEFENYIYNCIKAVLISSPGKMTDKKITIGDLIKYDYDAERVIEFKVENVVEKLLRAPIKSVLEDIEKDYNIKHNLSKEELQNLNRFSEIRNLFAHRRGIIDKKFIKNMGKKKYQEGIFLKLGSIEFHEYYQFIKIISTKFDQALGIAYPNLVSKGF